MSPSSHSLEALPTPTISVRRHTNLKLLEAYLLQVVLDVLGLGLHALNISHHPLE